MIKYVSGCFKTKKNSMTTKPRGMVKFLLVRPLKNLEKSCDHDTWSCDLSSVRYYTATMQSQTL